MKNILWIALLLASFAVPQAFAQTPQQKTTKPFTITVVAGLGISTISPLPGGFIGQAYSVQFMSINGTGAITWTVTPGSTLPAGLTLSSSGLLSGTLTTGGTMTFSVTATDSGAVSASLRSPAVVATK